MDKNQRFTRTHFWIIVDYIFLVRYWCVFYFSRLIHINIIMTYTWTDNSMYCEIINDSRQHINARKWYTFYGPFLCLTAEALAILILNQGKWHWHHACRTRHFALQHLHKKQNKKVINCQRQNSISEIWKAKDFTWDHFLTYWVLQSADKTPFRTIKMINEACVCCYF